jgi:hypothetical protein
MSRMVKTDTGIVMAETDVAFSLTCQCCDAEGPWTREEAHAEGWTGITYDDGPSWNFVGMCAECYFAENGRKPPHRRLRRAKAGGAGAKGR